MSNAHARGTPVLPWLVGTATLTAVAPLAELYASPDMTWAVLVCAVAAGSLPVWWAAARSRRVRTTTVTVLAAATGFAALQALVAVCTAGLAWQAASDVATGWLHGPAAMLTANLPLDGDMPDLAFLGTLTLLVAAASAGFAVRAAASVSPLLPPLLLFGVGIAVTVGVHQRHGSQTLAFGLAATLNVLVRAADRTVPADVAGTLRGAVLRATRRLVGRGLVPIVALALVAVTLVVYRPLTGNQRPVDPRALVKAGFQLPVPISPLLQLKKQLVMSPPVDLFTVGEVGEHRPGDRIRIAALESYNGVAWSTDSTYALAGHHFLADPRTTGATTVSADITIDGLDGEFLPVFGRLVTLSRVQPDNRELAYDTDEGTLADVGGVGTGFRYRISGQQRVRDDRVARMSMFDTASLRRYVVLPPDVPGELRTLSQALTSPGTTPLAMLMSIQAYLRTVPYRQNIPAGSSYASILNLLGYNGPGNAGGFAEQHAAAFAILARIAGIPTRVAVGYRIPVGPFPVTVTTAQADAWPESYFPGYGWMPFDPTDAYRTGAPPPPPKTGTSAAPPPPSPHPLLDLQTEPPPSRQLVAPAGQLPATTTWWPIAVAGGVLVVLVFTVLVGRKVRRRRARRYTGSSADQARGAWREAMDRLAEHGYRAVPSDTPHETADRVGARFGPAAAALREMEPVVAVATYSDRKPPAQDVERAWQNEREVWRALNGGRLAALRRAYAFLDLRPLWSGRSRR